MEDQQLYNERLTRIKQAIALEKPDRTPIYLSGPWLVKYGDPTAKMVDFITRPEWVDDAALKGYNKLKAIDAGVPPRLGNIECAGAMWLCRTKIPGRELPEDDIWQIDEVALMTEDDYDVILNKGWAHFVSDYLVSRLGYRPDQIVPDFQAFSRTQAKFRAAGLVELIGGIGGGFPFDMLCAARGMAKFYMDLRRMPDKIDAVLQVIAEELAAEELQFLRHAKPFCVLVQPAVRANSDFVSRSVFERFAWPLFKKFADIAIAEGTVVLFHMDSRWDRFLDFFTDFPKRTCIFDLDSQTDIYKVKEVLGDRMCITGDVSPALLTCGTPEEVYSYSRKLIEQIGPSGFILSNGCTVPPNSKSENIEALVAAAVA